MSNTKVHKELKSEFVAFRCDKQLSMALKATAAIDCTDTSSVIRRLLCKALAADEGKPFLP